MSKRANHNPARPVALLDLERLGRVDGEAPPPHAAGFAFESEHLPAVRALAADQAAEAGIPSERVDDFVIVANELASNALAHGEAPRRVVIWSGRKEVVCEVSNHGRIAGLLPGKHCALAPQRNPARDGQAGMGLWIVHQLCGQVEVRTGERTTVRAHLAAD
jgi:anti-sigma regulatory factor (Ser/Thr protein kinase)